MKLRELIRMFGKIQNADECNVTFMGKSVERVFLANAAGVYTVNLEPDNRSLVGRTISDPAAIRKIIGCQNRIREDALHGNMDRRNEP